MCGIAGFTGNFTPEQAEKQVIAMTDAMAQRGPDGAGKTILPGVALGHRRLSIIDLSTAASQPMTDPDDRYTLVFNGEIYNFRELKAELPDYAFQSDSDTDVILAAYLAWGPACVHRFNGMFAFAIWDKEKEELFIARDRLGIKPLYWYQQGDQLVFASEVRALLASGLVPKQLNRAALPEYLQYYSVNAPQTLLQDVYLLKAGHQATFHKGELKIEPYWSLADLPQQAQEQDQAQVVAQTRQLLGEAVEKRLISDVPFGAFLSGGIDSSAIVALMAQTSDQAVNTFSVIFEEAAYDESRYSQLMAKKYNTKHHPIPLQPDDFLRDLPEAMSSMDHPSGDGLNSYVVSKVTREAGFTVALSGLGGDELFAGYPVFQRYQKLRRMGGFYRVPAPIRAGVGKSVAKVYSNHKTARLTELISAEQGKFEELYPVFRKIFGEKEIQKLLVDQGPLPGAFSGLFSAQELAKINQLPPLSQVSVGEISTYTQHVLLRDTDQMSMASSLEVRVPFFDHKLVEYVLSLPDAAKPTDIPKRLLIEAMGDLLPDEVVYRKKMGFMFPWAEWIRGPLASLCEAKLLRLAERGIFQPEAIKQLWQAYLRHDKHQSWIKVWMLVALEHWMEANQIDA